MTNDLPSPRVADSRQTIPLTVLAQLATGVILGAVLFALFGKTAGLSALAGALAAAIPNGFFAARLLGSNPAAGAGGVLRSAWFGLAGKLLLTALLFGAIFAYMKPVSAPAVFGGFIATQLVVLAALLVDGRAGQRTS